MKKEIVIDVGEFCNKIITDQEGTKLYIDEEYIEGFIEMLEGLRDE